MPVMPSQVLRCPACFLAFGFGSGLSPWGPGTMGTLVAIPMFLLAAPLPVPYYLGATALLFAAGVWLCGRCEKKLGVSDHSGMVWDEFVGFFITMTATQPTLLNIALGFIFFRLFDILKPWPITWFDRKVHGGFGVMFDDVIAGLYAWCVLQGLFALGIVSING
ncbi:phosphatidylglycerophosphatase A [Candidatus Methylospira mobilis]|uniref:Phosphatidylglycerophosphatase A n=2 Tax=Candidatus Methylospira mobilis TaxID=1808979 RepID=A0A5Q0BMX9_9GAMM|nr:phosphatidylglycerophosphatase A [Candidatus Methylospira mobilis]